MNSQNTNNNFTYGFSSYGVKIGITAFNLETLNKAKTEIGKSYPLNLSEIEFENAKYHFTIGYENEEFVLTQDDEFKIKNPEWDFFIKFLEKQVFMTIVTFNKSRVFIHSGAVSYKNKGIIFPANTYKGKSTLTTEFIKAGADYYSDDIALLDEDALLHPFAKPISIREIEGERDQTEFPIEHFGGKVGINPVKVKLIVLTEFEKQFEWSPEFLSPGKAVMEILQHTVPIKFNPKFTLNVLHKLVNRAIIAKSKRGDAKLFVTTLLDFIEEMN